MEIDSELPIMKLLPERFHDSELNPEGVIAMGIAENALMTPVFTEYIEKNMRLHADHFKYHLTARRGHAPSTEDSLPEYINDTFHPRIPVTRQNSVVGPGVGSLIGEFCWQVCDDGEAFMITAPFYGGFQPDCQYPSRTKLVVVDVPPEIDPLSKEAIPYLEQTIEKFKVNGPTIRGVILCNPHNPLGRVYPEESIVGYASLAEKYDLHLLVDEIYGNQVYPSSLVPNPPPFVSTLAVDLPTLAKCDPARIHVVAGPSKDFGASGLRIGILVSQHNPEIIKLLESATMLNAIPGPTDAIFAAAINDKEWRDWFLKESRRRVSEAYEIIVTWCNSHQIPIFPSYVGQFAVMDLAKILERFGEDKTMAEKKEALTFAMLKAGVLIVPTGQDQSPTRYRIVFVRPKEIIDLALRRLEAAFGLPHLSK